MSGVGAAVDFRTSGRKNDRPGNISLGLTPERWLPGTAISGCRTVSQRAPDGGAVVRIGRTATARPANAALVKMEDLERLPVPSEEALRSVFSLTGAEARVAQGLAQGDSLEEIAAVLGVRISTARTQLAAIFGKTQTQRQAKLVALLSRLAHLSS
jgi:DNA-binding CsgD family transcriptional regulator